ncbi:MAG: MBL fold metallo-hydrolase [Opitutaceae bacterium]|nr:MBL fold metallo-hydrolase [Cytophagales bacterium]
MVIKQFEDKGLAHYSYAILSECTSQIVLIDPSRDISEYLKFAESNKAKITGVIETHPHADFVSGHLELHQKVDATIYCSKLLGADYPHQSFDDGDKIELGKITLRAIYTPGHSPDSICILLEHEGKQKAVFTGDTLFIGDCGRPDLREDAGNFKAKQKELAKEMYHSLHDKLMVLENETIVYPAHGAGTLCGKALSSANKSTIGSEKESNWSMKAMSEQDFVESLTTDQPFIPHYFAFDVGVNKAGALNLQESLSKIPFLDSDKELKEPILIIDGRTETLFKKGHIKGSINIQNGGKFETWLGSIIKPSEKFYLIGSDENEAKELLYKVAKIGYETNVVGLLYHLENANNSSKMLEVEDFKLHSSNYTIIDVRNLNEVKEGKIFQNSFAIPLSELRDKFSEIPLDKPIVVHCAGGYRSAAGSSILEMILKGKQNVYDLGEAVKMVPFNA